MSNVNRPRTGMKACPLCGSTERDSNGQCHCRNVLYRLTTAQEKAVTTAYNKALLKGYLPEEASDRAVPAKAERITNEAEVDSLARRVLVLMGQALVATGQDAAHPNRAFPRKENEAITARNQRAVLKALDDAGVLPIEEFVLEAHKDDRYRGSGYSPLYTKIGQVEPLCIYDRERGTVTLSARGRKHLAQLNDRLGFAPAYGARD